MIGLNRLLAGSGVFFIFLALALLNLAVTDVVGQSCDDQCHAPPGISCGAAECHGFGNCYFVPGGLLASDRCYECDGSGAGSAISSCADYSEDSCIADPCGIGSCGWDSGASACVVGPATGESCDTQCHSLTGAGSSFCGEVECHGLTGSDGGSCYFVQSGPFTSDHCYECGVGTTAVSTCVGYPDEGSCAADHCGIGSCSWDSATSICSGGTGPGPGPGPGPGAGAFTPGELDSCLAGCKTGQGEIMHLIRFAICVILRLIQLLCVIAAVLAITLAGILWISSDSSSQRATAKKIIMFALLGLIVVMLVIQLINAFITPDGRIYSIICETTIDTTIYAPIETVACVLYRVLEVGAILLAAVVITISGIMWVGSDSPEDRIRARNMMVYTIIGFLVVMLVLLFLGTIIAPGIPYTFDCDSVGTAPEGIATTLQYVACIALRLFQYAAVLLAVLVIALSGVRFIVSDRPEERTKARNMIAYTIVGFLVVFTAIALINVALGGIVDTTIPLASIDCSITSSAPADLNSIRETLLYTACMVIEVVNLVAAVLASLIVVLAGISFYTSDNPVSRNKAKILVVQTVIGLIIILLAMNLVASLFAGGGITSVEDATGAIFGSACSGIAAPYTVTDPINKVLCVIITIFQSIAAIVLILVIMAAGFRWAISDSPEDRVQSKRAVVYGVIGILVILISTNIVYALISAVSDGVISPFFITPSISGNMCQIEGAEVDVVVGMVEAFLCVILLAGFFLSGIVIALIIVYAGLKWITSDSPKDRTEAKWIVIKALIGYILIQVASQLVMALSSALVTLDLDIAGIGSVGGFMDFMGDLFGEPYIITCFVHLGSGGGMEGFIGLGIVFGQLWFIFCYLLRMMQIVAIAAAAIIIAVSGLKWIGSDSPEQRSYVKGRVLHTIVGLFIVILATSIVDALSFISMLSDMVSGLPVVGGILGGILETILEDVFHVDELYTNLCPGWVDIVGIVFSEQLRLVACILIRILQGVAAILATIVILLSGMAWMSSDRYEDRTRARDRILHAIIGLLIVMVALQLVNVFVVSGLDSALSLDCDDADTGEVVTLANTLGCIIVKILEALAGMLAAILVIITGYRWMTSEIPEERVKHRNRILSILVGLFITILALQLVMGLVSNHDFMQINPDCDPFGGVDCSSPGDELEGVVCTALYVGCLFIRIIMYIVAAVGVLMIIWAGVKWITSESPAERVRARNMVISVIIALIVILLALAFINYLVTGTRILSFWC